jgi:uncharacterized membrane protein YgaE (UPF0421/DUF939 family)
VTPEQVPTAVDAIELINRVASFYDVAWSQLLWFIGVAGAIVGVLVPLAVQFYQRRLFKTEEAAIKNELAQHLDKLKEELRAEIKGHLTETLTQELAHFDKKLGEKEAALERQASALKGGIYLVQGNTIRTRGTSLLATKSFVTAAGSFMDAEDQRNLQKVLNLTAECLQKVTKAELARFPDIEGSLNSLLDRLRNEDQDGRYANFRESISRELRAAKQRDAPKKGEG